MISQLFLAVLPDAFEFSQTTQGTISANSQPLSTLFFKMQVFDTRFSAGDLLVNKASWKCRHFPFVLGVTILHPVWCCVNALLKRGQGKAQALVDFSWQQTLQMFVFDLSPGFERDLDAVRADTKVIPRDARGVFTLINKRPYLQHWKRRVFSNLALSDGMQQEAASQSASLVLYGPAQGSSQSWCLLPRAALAHCFPF